MVSQPSVYNGAMEGDTPRGLKHELMLWQEALRRIGDNPVAHYLALAEQRRLKRIPRWRSYMGYGLIIALGLFVGVLIILEEAGFFWGGDSAVLLQLLIFIAGAILGLLGIGTLLYLLFTAHRRTAGTKTRRQLGLWLGLLPLGIALAILWPWLVIDNAFIGLSELFAPLSNSEVLEPLVYLALGLATLAYAAFAMGRAFAVVGDALRVLAISPRHHWQLAIDDLLSATTISDREIVMGFLRIIMPRLWPVSFLGAALCWLWLLVTTQDIFYYSFTAEHLFFLQTAPVTIGCVTLAGLLGGLVLVLWLIAHGRGSSGRYSAPITGALICIGHGVHVPFSAGWLIGLREMTVGYYSNDDIAYYLLICLPLAYAAVAAGYWMLLPSAKGYHSTAYRAFLAPLAYPLVMALIPAMAFLIFDVFPDEDFMGAILMSHHMGWSGTTLITPLAVPSFLCLGVGFQDWLVAPQLLEYNFILLILQQLVMIAIGLHHARLAVNRRRQAVT
jgi:hypothetical protein